MHECDRQTTIASAVCERERSLFSKEYSNTCVLLASAAFKRTNWPPSPFSPYKYACQTLPSTSTKENPLTTAPGNHRKPARQRMSQGNRGRGSRGLDLKLNLSLPARGDSSSSRRMAAAPADEESSPSSCLSSESEHQGGTLQWSDSPEATSMVLAACPRCFIYVMLSEADPRCPKCRSPVILDFLHNGDGDDADHSRNINTNRSSRRNRKG